MANTKVVNKKPRTAAQKRADAKMRGKRRKNPRRRTTKRYGAAARAKPRRRRSSSVARRRAPATKRYSRAPSRRSNPRRGWFDMNYLMETVPAATLGVMASRWAIKMAGPFEADAAGVKKPGLKHLIAAYLGATMGGQLIAGVMGDDRAGDVAEIAAYGYLGDLWAREFIFTDADGWYRQNLYLGSDASPYSKAYQARGLGQTPQGQTFTDANGRQYVKGPRGWQLAGSQPRAGEGQTLPGMGPMGGFAMQSGLGGFAMQSGLGQGQGVPPAFVPKGYMQKDHGYDSKRTIGHTYTYGGLYGRH